MILNVLVSNTKNKKYLFSDNVLLYYFFKYFLPIYL